MRAASSSVADMRLTLPRDLPGTPVFFLEGPGAASSRRDQGLWLTRAPTTDPEIQAGGYAPVATGSRGTRADEEVEE